MKPFVRIWVKPPSTRDRLLVPLGVILLITGCSAILFALWKLGFIGGFLLGLIWSNFFRQ